MSDRTSLQGCESGLGLWDREYRLEERRGHTSSQLFQPESFPDMGVFLGSYFIPGIVQVSFERCQAHTPSRQM